MLVTVARQVGSLGSFVATEVASRLEYRYLDRDILERAAQLSGYPDAMMMRELEQHEHAQGLVRRTLDALTHIGGPPELPSVTARQRSAEQRKVQSTMDDLGYTEDQAHSHLAELRRRKHAAAGYTGLIRDVVDACHQVGGFVIVGRAAHLHLRDADDLFRVLVVAPEALRVERVAERLELTQRSAAHLVRQCDREREAFARHAFGEHWLDASLYDLVINTERLDYEQSAALVVDLVTSDSRSIVG